MVLVEGEHLHSPPFVVAIDNFTGDSPLLRFKFCPFLDFQKPNVGQNHRFQIADSRKFNERQTLDFECEGGLK